MSATFATLLLSVLLAGDSGVVREVALTEGRADAGGACPTTLDVSRSPEREAALRAARYEIVESAESGRTGPVSLRKLHLQAPGWVATPRPGGLFLASDEPQQRHLAADAAPCVLRV